MLCKNLIDKAASKEQDRKKYKDKRALDPKWKYKYEKRQCELIKQNCWEKYNVQI